MRHLKKEPRERFIDALAKRPCVAHACRSAKVSRATAYRWREESEDFAAQWDAALEDALDAAEKAAWDRGLKASDTLLIFMLKAHRPDKYREKVQHEHGGKDGGAIPHTVTVHFVEPGAGNG